MFGFSEAPDLVRHLSDIGAERMINTQTPNEKRLAMNSYYTEEPEKINKQQEEKRIKKIDIIKYILTDLKLLYLII